MTQGTGNLLELNQQITVTHGLIRRARRRARIGVLSGCLVPLLIAGAVLCWYLIPQGHRLTLTVALVGLAIAFGVYGGRVRLRPGVLISRDEASFTSFARGERIELAWLELRSSLLRQEKSDHPEVRALNYEDNRASHKEEVMFYVDELREQATRNRRLNHSMQVTTIVGSLGATGLTSLSFAYGALGVVALVINFIVGVASGLAAYFKYKDRSFYAQQTANAIEQEWHSFNLGINRYKHTGSNADALVVFSEEVHRLRVEQKNREQNLDQPSKRDSEGD